MNNTQHGSQPIKNEQSGYQPTIDTMNPTPPQGNLDAIVFQEELLESQIQRILTAAKVSTVDEVVQMLERYPLSDEDIERAADKYAFENNTHRSNSKAFIAGANFAKQPIANEWVKVEDVKKYLTEQEKHSLEMCKVAKDNRDIFLEGISTGECVAFSLVSAFLTHLKNKI